MAASVQKLREHKAVKCHTVQQPALPSPAAVNCKAFSLRMQKETEREIAVKKGSSEWRWSGLFIGFGMELFFLADRVHPALRVIVGLGMLFLMIMIAGGMCRSLLSRKKTS